MKIIDEIEEDIKQLENFSNENILYGSTIGMTLERYKNLQLSTKHILLAYKRVLKEKNETQNKYIKNFIDKLKARRQYNNKKYEQAIDQDEFPEMYEYGAQLDEDNYILKILEEKT